MTKAQVEVITSVQRRRHWSRAEKERIVAAELEPGAVASEVARAGVEKPRPPIRSGLTQYLSGGCPDCAIIREDSNGKKIV
jgi:hypothetical protein